MPDKLQQLEADYSSGENALYELIFRQSSAGILIIDIKGAYIKSNETFKKMFILFSEKADYGHEYNIFTDPGYDSRTIEAIKKVFLDGREFDREIMYNYSKSLYFKSTGSKLSQWFKLRAYPVSDEKEIKFAVAVFNDINLKKETEKSLYQRTKELRILNDVIIAANNADNIELLLREITDQLIFNLNFDTGVIYFLNDNKTKAAIEYSSRNDRNFLEYFRELECSQKPFAETFKKQNSIFFENYGYLEPKLSKKLNIKGFAFVPLTYKDDVFGVIMTTSLKAHRFSSVEKKVLTAIGSELGTVINRQRTEQSLRENEERFRNIFDNSALGIFQFTPKAQIINFNTSFISLLGFDQTADDFLNAIDEGFDFFPDDETKKEFFNIISHNNKVINFKTKLKKSDGTTFFAKLITRAIYKANNTIDYYESFLEDISERMKSEVKMKMLNKELEKRVRERTEQLQNTNKEMEAFVYSVSHDLKAPIRSMNGFANILMEDYESSLDDTGKDYLKRILASSLRMGELINDLLELSKISRIDLIKEHVDITAICREIIENLTKSKPEKKVEYKIDDNLNIYADRKSIVIVLENLIGNACKFTSKQDNPFIEIGRQANEGIDEIFIKDNGAGFDMKNYDQLFTVFRRLHDTDDFKGTGVGLAICQRILLRHGGGYPC